MVQEFITAGKIVGAHGVRGEVKLLPQGIDTASLALFSTYYIDGAPIVPTARREHKGCLLIKLPGVDDMDAALALRVKPWQYAVRMERSLPVFILIRSWWDSPPGMQRPEILWERLKRFFSTPLIRSTPYGAERMNTLSLRYQHL